ncbi:TM2 domain-containing protein [Isoptericola sp. b441]|uniref:TM2 domain-containing protein n=1 Tax=Actinotalea lenta TaxID=3064654 RepID=A0ABT9DCR9_9CELL|nr:MULTISPECIES: TM2 domain-containing protein [unclassified Isoptericola]MDO8107096.1 TM2 domain-containing protein [Isoptericola sp. b441]MDO8121187.1 TM2 domain-containing protein [Isoptericola sp. b490]
MTGQPLSDKSKIVAGLLQIFLGVFGVGRFYTGHTNLAIIQLSLTLVGFVTSFIVIGVFVLIGVQIWVLVDGIMLLSGRETDARGLLLRS